MKKFKKRFLKFSCIISIVMVLTFTVISPFTAFAEAKPYPQYKYPVTWNQEQTDIYIRTLKNSTGSLSSGTPLNYELNGNTWFSYLTSSQRYGSYWNDDSIKFRWFLGRMTYLSISMDTGWDFNPPKLSPSASYDLHVYFDLDMKNYSGDGPISLDIILWLYRPETESYFPYSLNDFDYVFNSDDTSSYFDSSTGHFIFDELIDTRGLFDGTNDIILECVEVRLEWLNWTSSNQGGYLEFSSQGNYLLPYYENSQDLPAYPDYSDNQDLNNYNDKVGEVDSFVEGNLDNVSNMFTSGLTYLTGSFRNTMLYVGSVLTTLTNSKFLSVLVPISLSIGFIAFLLVGASFVSKSFKSKKGGG